MTENYTTESDSYFDFKAELAKYSRNWYWFVLGVVICMGIAFVYLRYATPQYLISTELLIRDDKKGANAGSMGDAGSAFSDLDIFKSHQNIDNEIEVLKSKSLLQRTFASMPWLQTSIFVKGTIKTSEVYGAESPITIKVINLDSSAFKLKQATNLEVKNTQSFILTDGGGSHRYSFGQTIVRPYGTFIIYPQKGVTSGLEVELVFHDLRLYADSYNTKMTIAAVNKDASALTISMESSVPQKGIDIINKLVEVYNNEAINDKNQIASNTVKFIDNRPPNILIYASDLLAYQKTSYRQ